MSEKPASEHGQRSAVKEHNLPMLRVHRAWQAAEKIGEAHRVDRSVALAIAREVIDIIGDGTQRWGHLCADCRSLLTWADDGFICPEHGSLRGLGFGPATVLLISFDPVASDV